jgi:hypothetical protein
MRFIGKTRSKLTAAAGCDFERERVQPDLRALSGRLQISKWIRDAIFKRITVAYSEIPEAVAR